MILYLVVLCYNEEEVVEESVAQLSAKLHALVEANRIDERSRIVLINDGSRDDTASIMHRQHENNPKVVCIHFSGNFGHQNAVLAGYNYAVDKYAIGKLWPFRYLLWCRKQSDHSSIPYAGMDPWACMQRGLPVGMDHT